MTSEPGPAAPAMPSPTPGASSAGADRAIALARQFGIWRLVALIGGILGFGYLWLNADGRLPEGTIWQVPLVLQLLILTWPWRTVSTRSVLGFFLLGFGPIFFLAVLSQNGLALLLGDVLGDLSTTLLVGGVGSLGNIKVNVLSPPTEELLKILPLLAVFFWARSGLRRMGGPLDFAILAGATGAGFGFAEDLFGLGGPFWSTPTSPLLGLGVGTAYTALVVNPLNRFPLDVVPGFELDYQSLVGILNPSAEQLPLGAIWAGHGVLPLFVGLVLGLAVMVRRRFSRLVYVLPALALLWVTWDHFVANWFSSTTCGRDPAPGICGLARLDLVGGLLPLVAIALFAGAILVSRGVVARHQRIDPSVHIPRSVLVGQARAAMRSPRLFLAYLRLLRAWLRLRNRVAFGDRAFAAAPDAKRLQMAAPLYAARTEALVLAERLRGRQVDVPAAAQDAFDRWRSPL